MNYGEVLGSAWKIIWRRKILWLFGLFVGGWSGLLFMFSSLFNYFLQSNILNPNSPLPSDAQALTTSAIVYELIFLGLMLVLGVFSIAAVVVGQIGIIRWTQLADQGMESFNLQDLFSAVRTNFWRVLGATLLLQIGFGLVVGVFFTIFGGVAVVTYGLGLICALPFFLLFVPISFLFRGYLEQTIAALVVENLGIGGGFARSWTLIRHQFLPLFLISLILLFGETTLAFIIASPYYITTWAGILLQGSPWPSLVLLIGELAYALVVVFLLSLLYTYVHSVWALTFLRLTKQSIVNAARFVEHA